jgi:hypothetical protein
MTNREAPWRCPYCTRRDLRPCQHSPDSWQRETRGATQPEQAQEVVASDIDSLQLYKTLRDLTDEAGAVDTVIGRPDVLRRRLAALRDAVGQTRGDIPAPPAAPTSETSATASVEGLMNEEPATEDLISALAQCRDAFPTPEPGSPLESQWMAAIACPSEVPEYVRQCVEGLSAAAPAVEGLAMQPRPVTNCVPGKVHCAKCGFTLVRTNLYVNSGTTGPGGEETEPCPNDGNPMLPVTWEQEAREAWKINEQLFDRAIAAEKALTTHREHPAAQQERQEVREALEGLVEVIEAAGLENLLRGVQLGQTVWYVKASDAMASAKAALAAQAQKEKP